MLRNIRNPRPPRSTASQAPSTHRQTAADPCIPPDSRLIREPHPHRDLTIAARSPSWYAGLIPQRSPTSKRVDFRCLRKSCARILIELNVHPKIIQQTLRHSDIRLTMDLYGELGEDDLLPRVAGAAGGGEELAG